MQLLGLFLFLIAMALVLGSLIYRTLKYGGFKAALFGAPIKKTLGEVVGTPASKLIKVSMKVHALDDPVLERSVGLELISKSLSSYQMTPISLSREETKKLIELLEAAIQPQASVTAAEFPR